MNYNPYDLVQLVINGKQLTGRPFEFDSEVVNQKTMTNAFGAVVKPSKVMTMCPDCGQGFELAVKLGDPPFVAVELSCPICKPTPPPIQDPFINPVKTGRIQAFELDPLLQDPKKPLSQEVGSVSDRFTIPEESAVVPPLASFGPKTDRPPVKSSRRKKSKKDRKKPPETVVQPMPTVPVSEPSLKTMTQQTIPERGEIVGQDDPFVLTKITPVRPVHIEKVEGLDEERDFDDSDMVE